MSDDRGIVISQQLHHDTLVAYGRAERWEAEQQITTLVNGWSTRETPQTLRQVCAQDPLIATVQLQPRPYLFTQFCQALLISFSLCVLTLRRYAQGHDDFLDTFTLRSLAKR